MRFSFRRKAQVRTNTLFIFIKSVPNAKETPNGRGGKVKPYKSGHSPLSPTVSPLHSFSLPSHPHQARFYRCALFFEFGSFIWLCLTSFTAAPLICNLQLTYRVSAVCFAWLCNVIPLICRQAQKLHTQKNSRIFHIEMFGSFRIIIKPYSSAITSTSARTPLGSFATSTQERAGLLVKYSP